MTLSLGLFTLVIAVAIAFLIGCPIGVLRGRRKLPMDGRFYFRVSVIPLLILMIIGIATILILRFRADQLDDPVEEARRGIAGAFVTWVLLIGPYLGGIITGNVMVRRQMD